MPKKISIAYHIVADPSEENEVTVYEVEEARKFVTKSVRVSFPYGTNGELEVTIKRGIKQIAPYRGAYQGDAEVIEDEFIEDISSGERVIIRYKNNNETQVREAYVLIRGELE